jgi:hypothetical protein
LRLQINGTTKLVYSIAMHEMSRAPRHVMLQRITEEMARLFVNQFKEMKKP